MIFVDGSDGNAKAEARCEIYLEASRKNGRMYVRRRLERESGTENEWKNKERRYIDEKKMRISTKKGSK